MNAQWTRVILKAAAWLCAEIALTCLGLDDLADYGEFRTQIRSVFPIAEVSQVLVEAGPH